MTREERVAQIIDRVNVRISVRGPYHPTFNHNALVFPAIVEVLVEELHAMDERMNRLEKEVERNWRP